MDNSIGWRIFNPALDALYIVVLVYYLIRYFQYFKNQLDPYTIICFISVIVSVVIRMITRLVYDLGYETCSQNDS